MATVVDFVEPCARKPRKEESAVKVTSTESVRRSTTSRKSLLEINSDTFEEMKRSVLELGVSGKSRKDQLKIQEQNLIKIGCAPRKKPKTPLPILKAMKIKNARKARARKTEARETDVIAASSVGKRRKTS